MTFFYPLQLIRIMMIATVYTLWQGKNHLLAWGLRLFANYYYFFKNIYIPLKINFCHPPKDLKKNLFFCLPKLKVLVLSLLYSVRKVLDYFRVETGFQLNCFGDYVLS
jgi:hypothetical protein